jgi:ABC-type transport system substrate-binding protein
MIREPESVMSARRILTALVATVLTCGVSISALAQSASPKAKPAAAKPETRPAAVAAGSAEPTLLGQYGTWGAYAATPNGKKVCFALAKVMNAIAGQLGVA